MNRTETDLRAMYRQQPGAFDTERAIFEWVTGLSTEAKVRRRSHATWTIAGAGITVLAFAGAAALFTVLGPEHSTGSATVSEAGAPSSLPSSAPVAPTTPPATVPITAQAAQQLLLDLLPRKGTVTARTGDSIPRLAVTELTFDDGKGPAEIALMISYPLDGTSMTSGPCDNLDAKDLVANCSTLADGTQVYRRQGYEYPDRRAETLDWVVSIRRPDGMKIEINEWNAATDKGSPVSRTAPPFTIEELIAVATSPSWTTSISAETAAKTADLFPSDKRLAFMTGAAPTATSKPTGLPSTTPEPQ